MEALPKLKPKWNKSKDDSFKKKEKVILNTMKIEEQPELEQVDSNLSLMERNPETSTETNLKVYENSST